jgi:hypothetical protein
MAGAVFLSYAREDTAAALRIADALRGEGVQVWFDQSELRGGDAWDSKIRRQIKECALFIPLISARTDARAEGYFRLEWKLAVDRSHLVADDTPFILPVVVDDTSEAAARVPEKCREVHWTRIRLNETPAEFAGRAARLVSGETAQAAAHGAAGGIRAAENASKETSCLDFDRGRPRPIRRGILFVEGEGRLSFDRGIARSGAQIGSATAGRKGARLLLQRSVRPGRTGGGRRLGPQGHRERPELGLRLGGSRWRAGGLFPAQLGIGRQVKQDTEAFAKRALALNPNEPQALLALGYLLDNQGAYGEAEAFLRRALAEVPKDNRIRRLLGMVVGNSGRFEEGVAIEKEAVKRQPKDVLAHYDLALLYFTKGTGPHGAVNGDLQVFACRV